MYDIRQFKPTLYILIFMGISGYALAADAPMFFVFPALLVALNAWLVKTGRFAPLPRWIANAATLLCLTWAGMQVVSSRQSTILVIGQFLVFLQLVKLYEQRANRDYAQLLILSLLLMVAASINTASLLFGVTLILYLFLSLYCCLLFHLKVETEHARSAMALPDSPRSDLTLRQDQRNLTRSMRRLTFLVSSASIVMAVLVFLFFPRGMGAGMLGPLQLQPGPTLTGFSDQISFDRIAAITQSQEIVATVKLYKNDSPVPGTQLLLLRGTTFDIYNGNDEDRGKWQWSRSRLLSLADPAAKLPPSSVWQSSAYGPGDTVWKQSITLKPTGTTALFAMPGAYALSSDTELGVRQSINDEILQSTEPLNTQVHYTVLSRGYLDPTNKRTPRESRELLQEMRRREAAETGQEAPPDYGPRGQGRWRRRSQVDPAIAAYAPRPEVTNGLAAKRDPTAEVSDLDEAIATAMEKHLQTQFTYTLDLTDSKRPMDQDPMVWFLSDQGRRGHCEYFAGAMTLMCQSLGMQARVVAGFKCDEYNEIGQYYQVRQSHAHAWVEVLTPHGWLTFDPTSGRSTPPPSAVASMWQKVKHLFNFMEFSWQKNVVAYDNDNRENLVANLNRKLTNSAYKGNDVFQAVRSWLDTGGGMIISSQVLSGFMGFMLLVLVIAVVSFVFEKYRLRRRAARIGLDSLSPSDQLKLARQLGFYDDLMRLLEKHNIVRPPHLTPQEFSETLSYLPSEVFLTVRRLTAIFYHIRYGRRELLTPRQKLLGNVIQRLQQFMQSSISQTTP